MGSHNVDVWTVHPTANPAHDHNVPTPVVCGCSAYAAADGILRWTRYSTDGQVSGLLSKAQKTLHYYGERAVRAAREIRWDVSQPALARPIFVIGCSRAGTTLLYKTLSESRELGSLQRETHDFWVALHPLSQKDWRSHALAASDASDRDRHIASRYFYAQTGARRVVDKNNQNGLCVPYLHALFPDAHFVYIKRSPGDNIHSLIEGWGRAEEFATWSADLPADVRIDAGRYRRWCFFLFEGWRDYVERPIEEVCAAQYAAMNQAIMDAAKSIPSGQWTEVVYEDLVRDPVGAFRRVFESCGLTFTTMLERHCANVLSTPYNAFSEIRLDKWRAQGNRERIERVLPRMADVAAAMGYVL
jgi:Sulfotransferase family